MAETRHRYGSAFLDDVAQCVTKSPRLRRPRWRCRIPQPRLWPVGRDRVRVGKSDEGIGYRNRDRSHGAFGGLVIEDGDAAHLAAARLRADDEFLQTLFADDDKRIRIERAVSRSAVAPFSSPVRTAPATRRRAGGMFRSGLGQAPKSSGCRSEPRWRAARAFPARRARAPVRAIVDQPPADCGLVSRRGGLGKRTVLLGAEHAGFLAAIAPLESLDGVEGAGADLFGAETFEIAEPSQIGLDGETIGLGNCCKAGGNAACVLFAAAAPLADAVLFADGAWCASRVRISPQRAWLPAGQMPAAARRPAGRPQGSQPSHS